MTLNKYTNTSESEKDKDTNTSQYEKDKDTNTSQYEKDKDTNTSQYEKDKDTYTSESEKDKDTNTSQYEIDKYTNTSESEKDKDTYTSESEKDKDTNTSESENDKDTNTSEYEIDKYTNTSEFEKDKDTNTSQYEKDKDTYTPESEKNKDTDTSESEKNKDTDTSESEKDKDTDTSESEKDKDTDTSESEKNKDTDTSESKKDKDTPESKKDKDTDTPESEKDKDTDAPESEEDTDTPESEKDTDAPESEKDKDTDTPESEKDKDTPESKKDKDTPESKKDKDTDTPESKKDKDTGTPESKKDKDTDTPESEKDKDTYTPESEKDKDTDTPESEKDTDTPESEEDTDTPESEKDTDAPESEKDKDTDTPESEKDTDTPESEKDTDTPESEEDTDTPESEKDTDAPESEKDKDTDTPESEKDKDTDTPESEKDKDTDTPEFEKDKDIDTPESEKDKDTDTPESEKDKDTPESKKDKDTNTIESKKDKDIDTPESEKDKDTDTPESEKDKDTDTPESEKDKDTDTPESEKDKDTDTPEFEKDKDNDTPESEKDKDTDTSESEKDKDTPESEKDKDTDSPEFEKDKDTDTPELEKDTDTPESEKDIDAPESEKDKDTDTPESEKEKDTDTPESEKDKDTDTPESEKDTDTPESEKDTDTDIPESEKDTDIPESEKDKDTDTPESEKDTDTPESEKDKDTDTPESEKDTDTDTPESEKDKDTDTPESEKDTDTPESEKDKDTDTPESEKDTDTDTPESEKDKDTDTPDSEKDKDTDTPESEKDTDTPESEKDTDAPESEKDKDTDTPESEKDTDAPESEKDKDTDTPESEKDKDNDAPESEKDKDTDTPESEKDKDTDTPESEKDKDTPESEKDKDTDTPESEKEKDTPESEKDTDTPESEKDTDTPESEKDTDTPESEKDTDAPESEKDKDTDTPESEKDTDTPESEKDTDTPESEKDADTPESEKDTDTPESEKDKDTDKKDKDTPESEKDTDTPESEKDTDTPESEKDTDTPESENDKDTDTPESEKDIDTPESEKDTDTPESEKDTDTPESEKDTDTPESEKDTDTPESEKDTDAPESEKEKEIFYLLAVTSQTVGGTTETLCVTVNHHEPVSMEVNLEYNQNSVTLLTETSINEEYYRCVPFQVPVVILELVASINIQIKGSETFLNKTTQILITPPTQVTLVQTDKPIYKPGQTVKFRIVSLDTDFLTYEQTFPTIEVQDPNSNRIGQWTNVATSSGLVDLSYPLNCEATKGVYIITVWDIKYKEVTQTFEVKDYVLPTFEVTVELPPVITILDTKATLKVCAKCSYGKPVRGTVKTTVCHNSYTTPDICRNYTMMTDETGCGIEIIDLTEYALSDSRYEASIIAHSEVKEDGTGVILTGSGSSTLTSHIGSLSFEDSLTIFKPRMTYEGKIKVTCPKSRPMKRKVVYLTVTCAANKSSVLKLLTNHKGIAKFSLDTEPWGLERVSLQAQYEMRTRSEHTDNQLTPQKPTANLWLQPFYSKSQSFIKLRRCSTTFRCNRKAVIRAQYMINSTISPHQDTINFFYMVMNKGHLVQQGRITKAINPGTEHKGNLVLTLENMLKVSPVAQVVLYTVLPSGEVLADSMNYPVKRCLVNKVSLKFSPSPELPGDQASLLLKAAPGSLCSVKAIDKSLLLLQPEKELSIQSVFNVLPVQTLSGYPHSIYEEDSSPCWKNPPIWNIPYAAQTSKSLGYFLNVGKVDVYSTFKGIGVKVLTNAEVQKPSDCLGSLWHITDAEAKEAPDVLNKGTTSDDSSSDQPVVTIGKKYFPETWIWDLVPVSQSGVTAINKTVPDSITTWQADAFCTSPVGFGVAPKTELIAFQPFFVSLTMPSSVIRGEVFTLKATVFNYLKSCMMVKVTLARSKQFKAQQCKNCSYTKCLCADESRTFSWTITPHVLGEIRFNVTAEAVQSTKLCGKKAVIVPEKGHIDTVINTLLVLTEGTKQYKSYNELLCPSDDVIEKTVSVTLPEEFVEGSAIASVSVLGDPMGRALQNLASLLAMPYGCGEQNMLRFAPNIFILQYLESTDQLTPEILSTAQTYLVKGYQRELNYIHIDGSYSAFGMSDASGNTWLTAFVMKSFGNAKRYIFIDQVFVDQAKSWLEQHQQENGCFASVGQLIHTDMEGGVNDELTLSAYITAAMLELNYTVTDPVVDNGLTCLRNTYTHMNSNYAKALLFYTFTLAGDQGMRNTLISDLDAVAIVSGGGRHWSRTDGSVTDSLEVEMTSYVLLALMSGPELPGFDLDYSASIVQWLSQQQNAFGGFVSTQDTVVALQALTKYSYATYSSEGSVTVTITSPSRLINTFTINQSNRLLYQEHELQEVPGHYNVKAEGKGCVYVQFNLHYNIPSPSDDSSFTISASAPGNCRVPNPSLDVIITVTYYGERLETNMVVIDVKPLSGFSVDATSVQLVNCNTNSTDGAVKRVDQIKGNTIIYVNGLINGEEKVYTMALVQELPVQKLQPAVVEVYDYYETGERASADYISPCQVQ
ncbi:alpha-2-macroglobulin-like protein 1 [Tachysurus vachellii]|uniref:alpha-2-macroglobulin-like protein 1 n=1 Tax=Tachysurus vachellii TaxID=175792 RepID=UPI00296B0B4A|nr:alpha-2-macroglobulin-like protein 1 [Tachysurus vachellii]